MEDLMLALIWLGFFASVFFGWYYFLQARNKERMALIERDKDVSEIYAKREFRFRFPWLKLGLLITGIAFGGTLIIFLSGIPTIEKVIDRTNGFAIFVALMLFGGISMIIAHYVDKPSKN
ncbi:DUF6249 domain-containing protein [uncultured Sunxiuqinia sp.]|uniref:DUF6249 domain-containing protein n=1 Tax=Sunxiuqinia rutila TaxID=1397841 RepID=UPI00261CA93E|nr:DUF6249 domain-containing protein [uncultured Sunxiuqinia sp.]